MQKKDREKRNSSIKDNVVSLIKEGYSKTEAVKKTADKFKLTSVSIFKIIPNENQTTHQK